MGHDLSLDVAEKLVDFFKPNADEVARIQAEQTVLRRETDAKNEEEFDSHVAGHGFEHKPSLDRFGYIIWGQ